ncbi:putative eka-like protein [Erysiphe necator]|uniref:Putative eka-like protein n=1 Tax=Uncinula necator TaxID=52586 RepID=A0A0B1P322_UNCNE|nr:putative eka-like protein [Erysiphe necator]
MPAIRPKRTFTMIDIAKDRARSRLKRKGLSQNFINLENMENDLREKGDGTPDIEMIDEHIDKLIAQGLKDSIWAKEDTNESITSTPIEETDSHACKSNQPHQRNTERNKMPEETTRKTSIAPSHPQAHDLRANITQRSENSPEKAPEAHDVPPELRKIIEAEKRRAAKITANLRTCTIAINGVQMALSTDGADGNKEFSQGLLIYLRAAIAQFMANGPGTTLPVLPSKPTQSLQVKQKEKSALPCNKALPQKLRNTEEKTWASIARKGNQVTPAIPTLSAVPSSTQKHLRADREKGKRSKPNTCDDRLFLRLTKEHEWRPLAPSAIREIICKHLECSLTDILLIRRTATGLALTAKDKETRQLLLDKSSMISTQNATIEPASDLVTYHIPNVPVAIQFPNNKVFVTKDMVKAEIKRVTQASPTTVRPHGKTKAGAPYQAWLAHFPRPHAPRVGFRIFDESGLALVYKPRQNILQCKRCLGFHPTRGCSRALARANCESTMHLTTKCKAPTRCRNCGGPHKSENRNCLARPSRSGPATKE